MAATAPYPHAVSRRGWFLFIALSIIWGIPYLFIKVAVEDLSPAMTVFGRTALAAAVLLPVAVRRDALRPVLARWRWVLGFAVVEMAVPFGLLSWAEQRLSSSLTGLLVAVVPLLVAGLGAALGLTDRLDLRRFVGLIVGLAGVALLVGIDVRGGDLLGAAAVLGAAAGYAVGPIVADQRLADLPGVGVSAVALAVNAVAYLPWALATRPTGPVPWPAWASVAGLGLGSCCWARGWPPGGPAPAGSQPGQVHLELVAGDLAVAVGVDEADHRGGGVVVQGLAEPGHQGLEFGRRDQAVTIRVDRGEGLHVVVHEQHVACPPARRSKTTRGTYQATSTTAAGTACR